jgi:hypothetical protein
MEKGNRIRREADHGEGDERSAIRHPVHGVAKSGMRNFRR